MADKHDLENGFDGWTVDESGHNVIEVHREPERFGTATVAQLQPHAKIRERAKLLAAAPQTATERDRLAKELERLREVNAELFEPLRLARRTLWNAHLDNGITAEDLEKAVDAIDTALAKEQS